MADISIKIKTLVEDAGGDKSISGIRASIKALKSEALALGDGAKGYKELSKAAGELQDKLDDLQDSSKSLQGTGIEKLKSSFGLLTDSFKNADFGKAKTAFQGLGSAMKAVPIFLLVEGIMYLVENFEKLSQGSGLLGKALRFVGEIIAEITKGITWLLDKLGLVNAKLDEQSEKLTSSASKAKEAIEKQNTAYDQQIAIARSAGKATIDLEVQKQKAIIETNKALVEQAIAYVRAGGVLSEEQKKNLTEQLNTIKGAVVAEQVILNTAAKEKSDKWKKAVEENKKAEAEAWALTLKIRAENSEAAAKDDLRIAEENKAEQIRINKEMLDEMNAEAEQAAKEDAKNSEARAEAMAKAYRNSFNGLKPYLIQVSATLSDAFKGIGSDLSNLASTMVTTLTTAFDTISSKSASTTEKVMAGLQAVGSLIGQISSYLSQEAQQQAKEVEDSYSRQSAALNTAKDEEIAKEGLTADQKVAIENKYKTQDYNLKLIAYNKETEIKKKAFEQDKKLKIAQTVIATITGVVSAVTGMIAAVPGPVGIVLGALAGVAVAAMGAIQVAQISKTKFDAGSPPAAPTLQAPTNGADAGGVGSQEGPSLKRVGRTPEDVAANGGTAQRQGSGEPIRAYVVSQDVTTAQDKNAVIERRSSF